MVKRKKAAQQGLNVAFECDVSCGTKLFHKVFAHPGAVKFHVYH